MESIELKILALFGFVADSVNVNQNGESMVELPGQDLTAIFRKDLPEPRQYNNCYNASSNEVLNFLSEETEQLKSRLGAGANISAYCSGDAFNLAITLNERHIDVLFM